MLVVKATLPLEDVDHCVLVKVCQKGIQVLQVLIQQHKELSASYSSSFFLILVGEVN